MKVYIYIPTLSYIVIEMESALTDRTYKIKRKPKIPSIDITFVA